MRKPSAQLPLFSSRRRDVTRRPGGPEPQPVGRRRAASARSTHQLKVTLLRSRPPIWRRLEVRSDITLHDLHLVLEGVMGWEAGHPYEFRTGPWRFQALDPEAAAAEFFHVRPPRDSRTFRLWEVAPEPGSRLHYEYDFAASWMHAVVVEKILPPERTPEGAVCRGGRRACPPDECGGISGYQALLYARQHPEDPEVADLRTLLAPDFDPARFDVAEANERLASRRSARPPTPR